ncbi:MAG: LysM peptidoglycan-binding domain-containing protein [Bacilli bacterium]|nr:LysM peptidoglycan-binding domain-containing protein [Bacilli bacterium]
MQETYTVKPGDTLYGISNQYGVSVTELAELNGIKGSNLAIGTILKIPNKSGTNPSNMFMYTVKKGDTLYSVATKYKTTPKKIMDLNYLKSTSIKPGDVLRIPETYTKEEDMSVPNYISYTIKKGDTLYSIAKANNVPIDTIISDNNLTSNNLNVGKVLKIRIPNNTIIEECYGSDYTPQKTQNYIVKSGDNLYSIAKKFNTTVDEIKRKNNLKTNTLSIGQKLII